MKKNPQNSYPLVFNWKSHKQKACQTKRSPDKSWRPWRSPLNQIVVIQSLQLSQRNGHWWFARTASTCCWVGQMANPTCWAGMVTIKFVSELPWSFMENLNQGKSMSVLMTFSTAFANKGLFELTRCPSLKVGNSLLNLIVTIPAVEQARESRKFKPKPRARSRANGRTRPKWKDSGRTGQLW